MADPQDLFRRARFQAVIADLLDAYDGGAAAGRLVDMLMDAAPLLAPSTAATRDWTSPRAVRGSTSRRKAGQ